MCVNNLSKVALDSAAAGIEPAISSCKSNALATTPPSHYESDELENVFQYSLKPKENSPNSKRQNIETV